MIFYFSGTGNSLHAADRLLSPREELVSIAAADTRLSTIAEDIAAHKAAKPGSLTFVSDLMGVIYKKSMGTSKFYAEDSCIGCGKCAKNCPMDVIQMMNGKPVWIKDSCCKCSACVNQCPVQAVQYGKHTVRRNRYHFPEGNV